MLTEVEVARIEHVVEAATFYSTQAQDTQRHSEDTEPKPVDRRFRKCHSLVASMEETLQVVERSTGREARSPSKAGRRRACQRKSFSEIDAKLHHAWSPLAPSI